LVLDDFPKIWREVSNLLLKYDNDSEYLTQIPVYIYNNTSLNSSQNEKYFRRKL